MPAPPPPDDDDSDDEVITSEDLDAPGATDDPLAILAGALDGGPTEEPDEALDEEDPLAILAAAAASEPEPEPEPESTEDPLAILAAASAASAAPAPAPPAPPSKEQESTEDPLAILAALTSPAIEEPGPEPDTAEDPLAILAAVTGQSAPGPAPEPEADTTTEDPLAILAAITGATPDEPAAEIEDPLAILAQLDAGAVARLVGDTPADDPADSAPDALAADANAVAERPLGPGDTAEIPPEGLAEDPAWSGRLYLVAANDIPTRSASEVVLSTFRASQQALQSLKTPPRATADATAPPARPASAVAPAAAADSTGESETHDELEDELDDALETLDRHLASEQSPPADSEQAADWKADESGVEVLDEELPAWSPDDDMSMVKSEKGTTKRHAKDPALLPADPPPPDDSPLSVLAGLVKDAPASRDAEGDVLGDAYEKATGGDEEARALLSALLEDELADALEQARGGDTDAGGGRLVDPDDDIGLLDTAKIDPLPGEAEPAVATSSRGLDDTADEIQLELPEDDDRDTESLVFADDDDDAAVVASELVEDLNTDEVRRVHRLMLKRGSPFLANPDGVDYIASKGRVSDQPLQFILGSRPTQMLLGFTQHHALVSFPGEKRFVLIKPTEVWVLTRFRKPRAATDDHAGLAGRVTVHVFRMAEDGSRKSIGNLEFEFPPGDEESIRTAARIRRLISPWLDAHPFFSRARDEQQRQETHRKADRPR